MTAQRPIPPTRKAVSAAAASGQDEGESGREAYRRAVRPFLAHWLELELSRRMYDSSVRVITDLRQHAEPELQATYAFYEGEAYRRRGDEGDLARAHALYAEAIALPSPPAAAYREHGLALRDGGRRAEAATALRRYLELAPAAEDAAFVRQYLAELEATP